MISEPELTGEFGPEHTGEAVGGFDRKPASGRRGGHGLLWGAAGALAASAVWATAVFAYGIGGDRKPDTHGYQVGGRSCSVMQMTTLTASVGKRAEAPSLAPGTIETPALDSVSCAMSLASPDAPAGNDHGWSYRLHVGMSVELHKETDPLPEFDARKDSSVWGDEAERSELVPGLGDRAYLLVVDEQTSELRVVEGGAVIKLSIAASMDYASADEGGEPPLGEPDPPAVEPYHADLITDMRDVMKKLKTG